MSSGFARSLWVLVLPLMFWLCYWGACRGTWVVAAAAGLPTVVAVSGFAALRFWKDPNDPNHPICYLPT